MKKLLIFSFILAVTIGMVYSQSITINQPSGGTWYKGTTHNITWTATGCSSTIYKINIFRGSIDTSNFVEQLTKTGTPTKSWTIPMSYTNGTYYIRIKTDPAQTGCQGDSRAFTITDDPSGGSRGSITVRDPARGIEWTRGTSQAITWDSSGDLDRNVKINIFRGSIDTSNFVEQLTGPNSGSKSWAIPDSYEPGTYILRVKEAEGDVKGDSAPFEIKEGTGGLRVLDVDLSVLRGIQDLELTNVYFTWAFGGRVVARIKSNVNPYRGDVTISYKTLPSGAEKSVTKSVSIAGGAEKVVTLFSKTPDEIGCSGISLKVSLDPANAISESNENNNVKFKTVYKYLEQDGLVESVQIKVGGRFVNVPDDGDVDVPTGDDYRTEIRVKVRNCGGTRLEGGRVDVFHNLQTTRDGDSRIRCRSFNESIGNKSGIALSPGISRTYIIPVVLNFQTSSDCRKTINEISVKFNCGDRSIRDRNNVLTFSLR
ncbi:MAG: Ser-Thr-rich GPI-anchored membrane family protein [Acidobacteriota bacterium]